MLKEKIGQALIKNTIKKVIVLELIEIRDANTSFQYTAIQLHRAKENISIEKRIVTDEMPQFLGWLESIESKVPIILLINSDKILHAVANVEESYDTEVKFKEMIHGAILGDFYTQTFGMSPTQEFLSLIRKGSLDLYLQTLESILSRVIHVAIGPFALLYTRSMLEENTEPRCRTIIINYSFRFDEDVLSSVKILPHKKTTGRVHLIPFGDENIHENIIVAYSYGIYFLLQPMSACGIELETIQQQLDEYIYRRQSKTVAVWGFGIIFIFLLISSSAFTIYRNKYQLLQRHFAQSQEEFQSLQQTEKKSLENRQLLHESGLDHSANVSFYADQLTSILPQDMYLRKLEIFPLEQSSHQDNPTSDTHRIIVEGNCYSSNDLNRWVEQVKYLPWVKDIIINNYAQPEPGLLSSFHMEVLKQQ